MAPYSSNEVQPTTPYSLCGLKSGLWGIMKEHHSFHNIYTIIPQNSALLVMLGQ